MKGSSESRGESEVAFDLVRWELIWIGAVVVVVVRIKSFVRVMGSLVRENSEVELGQLQERSRGYLVKSSRRR